MTGDLVLSLLHYLARRGGACSGRAGCGAVLFAAARLAPPPAGWQPSPAQAANEPPTLRVGGILQVWFTS